MIPIRDENYSRKRPWFRNFLILANIAIFVYMFIFSPGIVVDQFGFIGAKFLDEPMTNLYRFVSYQFIHGGLGHLLGNLWFLYIFGDNVEAKTGHFAFLFFYLFCGVISAIVQIALVPSLHVPLIGASGSIAGVLGAYAIYFPRAKIITWIPLGFVGYTARLPAFFFLFIWFAYQFILGSASSGAHASVTGVAWWAHVGGFVFGLLFGIKFR
ncbi:MAG: rhomboid family intramembrane serine protease [Elusimicrobia bacterium]|nr:rhomboid family intramembrane serine protease [Elusimicrobiota bacterium]